MSDRTSASIYGDVFIALAKTQKKHPEFKKQIRALARRFWDDSTQYDFSPCDMYADDELVALGLAKRSWDSVDECDVYVYRGEG